LVYDEGKKPWSRVEECQTQTTEGIKARMEPGHIDGTNSSFKRNSGGVLMGKG